MRPDEGPGGEMKAKIAALLLSCAMAGSCAETTGPDPDAPVPEEQLQFLRFPPDLAPLVQRQGSFWAVKGQNREIVLRYAPEPGEDEGEEFLEFEVSGNSLLRRPNGTLFQRGDSVLITVAVDPDNRMLFNFEPSGLQFDPAHPAELEITYRRLRGDLNGDGQSDGRDRDIERRIRIWKQERPGQPWRPLGTARFEDAKELEAKITSFTGFCIAT